MTAKPRVVQLGRREIAIGDLKPHPANPNHGSVNDIAASLEQFGQYRSIVATKDLTIVAGHHVVQAAKNLGLKTLQVDLIDTDEKTATKIMLADNRIAELGVGPDLELLLADLEELSGDIAGTGYDEDYIKLLEEAVLGPPASGGGGGGGYEPADDGGEVRRRLTLTVERDLAEHWDAHRKLFDDDSAALAQLLRREARDE